MGAMQSRPPQPSQASLFDRQAKPIRCGRACSAPAEADGLSIPVADAEASRSARPPMRPAKAKRPLWAPHPGPHRRSVAEAAPDRPIRSATCWRLRPVQCADPGARLPRGRPALAAGADAGRSAGPQARLRGAVAPQRQCAADPWCQGRSTRPIPVRWRGCCRRTAPIRRWTCSWCRCRSSSAARRTGAAAGSRCCSRKTGRSSAASAACWRSCSTAATPWCSSPAGVAARHRRRGPAARTHRAQALARAAHAFPPHPRGVIGPDLSTRRMLVDKVLAAEPVREAIADQAKRDKSKPRTPGRRRTPTPTKSPPTIRTRWCARPASC
jgi:hypothetical protein